MRIITKKGEYWIGYRTEMWDISRSYDGWYLYKHGDEIEAEERPRDNIDNLRIKKIVIRRSAGVDAVGHLLGR